MASSREPAGGRSFTLTSAMVCVAFATALSGCARDDSNGQKPADGPDSGGSAESSTSSGGEPRGGATGGKCLGRRPTMVGTAGDDVIRASPGRDVIATLGGNDRISGTRKADVVCAGAGDDVIDDVGTTRLAASVQTNNDIKIDAGPGSDVVTGDTVGVLDAGGGADRVRVERDARQVLLGAGDDRLVVRGSVHGSIKPGLGDDRVSLEGPHELGLYDGPSNCVDYGDATGPVRVDLGAGTASGMGHDHLEGVHCVYLGPKDNVAFGSPGRDVIQSARGRTTVYARGGVDDVSTGVGPDRIDGGPGNDSLFGSDGDDRIYGRSGRDSVEGAAGNDRLYGGPGEDSVIGYRGADYLEGGSGNDFLTGGFACDTTVPRGPGALLDTQPNEVFGGPGNDYLIGDRGNDRLDGGPGHDEGQPGWRDGRIDRVDSVEVIHEGCAQDF